MENESVRNIPHMKLFLLLKKQFPELRDAYVTDCIQRFGLNKELCETELKQRINEQQKVYYSPWSPRRPSSRTSDDSTSSSSAMALTNGETLPSSNIAPQEIDNELSTDIGQPTDEHGRRSPHSAPVYVNSNPFHYQPIFRRKSAETTNESRKLGVLHKLNEHPETEGYENMGMFLPERTVSPFTGSPDDTPTSPPSSTPASNTLSSSSQYSETSSRDVDVAAINDQLKRSGKLEGELKYRKEVQNKLHQEVQSLRGKHEEKESEQKRDIDDYKKKIDNLMKENLFILSNCDTMDRTILEEYDDPSMAALEKRDNQDNSHSIDVNPGSSPFKNNLGDRSQFGEPLERNTAPRSGPVAPTSLPSYPLQDLRHLTEEVECDWACCRCTFLNHATLSHCEMCGLGNFPGGKEQGSCYCHRRVEYDHVARSPVRNT